MNAAWKEKSVGEVLRLEYGKPLNDSDRKSDGLYPVYGANGEKDRSDKFYFDRPSIIVGRKGSAGEVNLSEEKFWPLDVTYFVTFDERQHELRFLYYLLTTLNLPSLAKGVKPGINRNEVYSQVTKIPPLPEQQRIVGVLDEAFEGIATAKATAEKNLQNSRAIFKSHLQFVFTQRGKGWVEKTTGDLCEVIAGQSPEGKFYNTDGKGMSFYQGKKDFGEKFIEDPTTWTTQTTKIAQEGDILMSVRAPVGPVNFATHEICIGRGLAAIRSKAELNRDFLFYQLLYLQPKIAGKEGAVFDSINKSEIETLPIVFAPLPEQQRIVKKLDSLREETQRLESLYQQKLAALESLKKSLLRQAFIGEL